MRTLIFLLEKEFRQMMRNKQLMSLLIIAPLIQLILLPLAANYSVKNINIAIVDNDHSTISQRMIHKITASGNFRLTGYANNYNDALKMVEEDKADLILQIPANFEKNLVRENHNQVYLAINAIEGTKANLGGGYLASILRDFNENIRVNWVNPGTNNTPQVVVASTNWYNPYMNYHLYIVPAILVSLITSISAMQSAFNIVQEKESGTIEQINVSPIRKHIFITGKLIPFLVLGIFLFTLGLLAGWLFYGIVPVGKLYVLYISLVVYLFTMLGLGLLISTYSNSHQQALSLSFFFINIFNIMSGTFNSVDSMPGWAKTLVSVFPPSHFIRITRMVMLKGSSLADISGHLAAIFLIGLILNTWAVLNYHKTA
ncbi:MAG: transporter permease [Bacteroidota bacterium]|nr:transporter permease [Bacteroidota bacterium]